ncbi:MAG: tripartite tricarboxylate transporter TctB family protein [Hydrogenophaga sp.]|uniref:tripartite tricarboxylate transporter TctB family protein n=1 Tax=Hydrogenophaga sp. TaxID=1904254 RepID=UPI002AB8F919|nr:tripartite tricarboxylate transporter TctB family protein [Hydrogenophaga sp.]MDZ4100970.1 tripartite tricarboxylate transporter TctB family protein [Hydrogenophaga sp.]
MSFESDESSTAGASGSGGSLGMRWPELLMAAFMLAIAVLVIIDSRRVGTGWGDDGPKSGYFPFYIGLLLALSSGWILLSQLRRWSRDTEVFAEHAQLRLVMAIFIPMVVYVAMIFGIGIYFASALLIGYFMLRYGRYRLAITLPVAIGVPLFFYVVFERWFLVMLPKGPIESLLGL